MLVLDRLVGEQIIIETSDGPITVTLCKLRPRGCRLGIDAPARCFIWRPEERKTQKEKAK